MDPLPPSEQSFNPSVPPVPPILPPQQHNHNKVVLGILVVIVLIALAFFALTYFNIQSKKSLTQNSAVIPPLPVSSVVDQRLVTHTVSTYSGTFDTNGPYAMAMAFDGNGKNVMYLEPRLDGRYPTADLFQNDQKLGTFLDIYNFSRSADGSRINFAGLKIVGTRDNSPIVEFDVNGIKQNYAGTYYDTHVIFSKDGAHYAYVTLLQNRQLVTVYDGKSLYVGSPANYFMNGKQTGNLDVSSPILSPDDSKLAVVYGSSDGLKEKLVIIDVATGAVHEDPDYEHVWFPTFSRDSMHRVYTVWLVPKNSTGQQGLVIDGRIEIPAGVSNIIGINPQFNTDGTRISYGVAKGSYAESEQVKKAIDVKTGKDIPYSSADFAPVAEVPDSMGIIPGGTKIYDSTGTKWLTWQTDNSLIEKTGKVMVNVTVNGFTTPDFDYISLPQFDSSGQYIMFGARKDKSFMWQVYKITPTGLVQV